MCLEPKQACLSKFNLLSLSSLDIKQKSTSRVLEFVPNNLVLTKSLEVTSNAVPHAAHNH